MDASSSLRSTGLSDRRSEHEEDSLDEGSGSEGGGNLQLYLQDGGLQDSEKTANDGLNFAMLWPPHQPSSLPPASAATLNLITQPHSPATIAQQLIAQARGGISGLSFGKMSPSDPSRLGYSVSSTSPSKAAAAMPSNQSINNAECTDAELRARELYGDYVWIVQKTQASDDVGGSIQVG